MNDDKLYLGKVADGENLIYIKYKGNIFKILIYWKDNINLINGHIVFMKMAYKIIFLIRIKLKKLKTINIMEYNSKINY